MICDRSGVCCWPSANRPRLRQKSSEFRPRDVSMKIPRRSFLAAGVAALAGGAVARSHGLKIGITDWNLHLSSKVDAVEAAARLRFDGVQVSLGRKPVDGKLPL